MQPWSFRAALFTAGLSLAGCGQGAALTVHNGTEGAITVEGLPSGSQTVQPSEDHRESKLKAALTLVARDAKGQTLETMELSLPPEGGEALWTFGSGACYLEGDFSAYYGPLDGAPPAIRVVATIGESARRWQSKGPIAAGPGERLPTSRRGGPVHALVRVPCQAIESEDIARGWLEMMLPSLQPQ